MITDTRHTYLGGSDAAAALGISPWKTPLQLYLEKIGETCEPDAESDAMRWGSLLEDPIAQEYAVRTGKKVHRVNKLLQHPRYPWMCAHLDRRIVGEQALLEVKTANGFAAKAWGEAGSDQVPDYYLTQVAHYLAVTGYERADVAVLVGGSDFRIYHVDRDDALIEMIELQLGEFWQRVERRDPPNPLNAADAARRWRERAGGVAVAKPEVSQVIADLRELKARQKALEEQRDAMELLVKCAIGEAQTLTDEGGAVLATWKEQTSRRLDQKRLRDDHPELAWAYTTETITRVLRVKETK